MQLIFFFFPKQKLRDEVKLDLLALLIQPVQRIPRYRLLLEVCKIAFLLLFIYSFLFFLPSSFLLKDLIKKTDEKHSDYSDLKKASIEVASIAGDVDKQMDKQENLIKLCKIKSSFVGNVPKVNFSLFLFSFFFSLFSFVFRCYFLLALFSFCFCFLFLSFFSYFLNLCLSHCWIRIGSSSARDRLLKFVERHQKRDGFFYLTTHSFMQAF